jgi:formylglycine-generating enzyme
LRIARTARLTCVATAALALVACSAPGRSGDVPPAATMIKPKSAEEPRSPDAAPPPPASASASSPAAPAEPADEMVSIPAATFWMGCAKDDKQCRPDEKPRHRVSIDAYAIDKNEVTVRDYLLCVAAGKCSPPDERAPSARSGDMPCNWKVPGRELHPITCVNSREAEEYCAWRGKRLPTEAEWEHAARGNDERILPWGRTTPGAQPFCREASSTCPVGSFPEGASPFGVLDMAGNAAEWVWDTYHPAFYAESPVKNPRGPLTPIPVQHQACSGSSCATMRGGSWQSDEAGLRATARGHQPVGVALDVGFRCARAAAGSPAPAP